MKIIEPSVEYWQQGAGMEGVWKQIAKATRVCYQSTPKNNGESDEDFVKRVILKPALIKGDLDDLEHCKFNFDIMHGSTLEHGTVYLLIPFDDEIELRDTHIIDNENAITPFQKIYFSPYTRVNKCTKNWAITTNLRYILETKQLYLIYKYLCEPTEYHSRRYTFSIITNIGVTRECNRHRVNSPSEESTRWCTYSAGKFGSEISYAEQDWMGDIYKRNIDILSRMTKQQQLDTFKNWCKMIAESNIENWTKESFLNFGLAASEFSYLGMKKCHAPNDEARTVLNLGTKTQEIVTAFKDDWEHFLKLRADNASGKVHPDMQIIAKKIKDIIETL